VQFTLTLWGSGFILPFSNGLLVMAVFF